MKPGKPLIALLALLTAPLLSGPGTAAPDGRVETFALEGHIDECVANPLAARGICSGDTVFAAPIRDDVWGIIVQLEWSASQPVGGDRLVAEFLELFASYQKETSGGFGNPPATLWGQSPLYVRLMATGDQPLYPYELVKKHIPPYDGTVRFDVYAEDVIPVVDQDFELCVTWVYKPHYLPPNPTC